MGFSRSNILSKNRIISNSEYGLYMLESGNSSIYNNYFNNTNNTYLRGLNTGTNLNTTLVRAENILNGDYRGGNYWATPEGDGFSQTHTDKDGDGICDVAYVVDKECVDYLPLADPRTTNQS
jgi:parallel beta-helix repeat protein